MYKGALEAFTDPNPRILTETSLPGWPKADETCTPEVLPSKAADTVEIALFSIDLAVTVDAEPVNDDFLEVP